MLLSPAKILRFSSLGFIAGIAFLSWLDTDRLAIYNIQLFGLAAVFFVLLVAWPQKKRVSGVVILLILFFILGIWRMNIEKENERGQIKNYNGRQVEFIGRVSTEPDKREKNTKLEIKSREIKINGQTIKVFGKVLVTTSLYPEYNYGEELKIKCDLREPEPFDGFAYDRYLARYGIYSVCYYPKIDIRANNRGNMAYAFIYRAKENIRAIINRGLNEPNASLTNAIILGDKKGLPEDLQTAFSRTGLSHIIAISGMNISLLSLMIMSALLALGLWRQHAFYFAALALVIYIILVGAPASAVRAGIMGFLVLWATHIGRLSRLDHTLLVAAAAMLVINPRLLYDDIGFQLSFLAMYGLAFISPVFSSYYEKVRNKFGKNLLDMLNMTVAAQVFTWPIIIYHFGVVSLIAPAANLLVLWILPLQMIGAFAAIALSLAVPAFAVIAFSPVFILNNWLIAVAKLFSAFPGSYITAYNLDIFWLMLYYLIAMLGLMAFRHSRFKKITI
jgi:competence protein ComEC